MTAASKPAKRIGVTGLGMYVPPRVLSNDDIAKMVDTNDEWIRSRTGIRERRIADPGTTTSDLAYRAGKEALKSAGLDPKKLELIIVATTTPDMLFPSASCLVQQRLGATNAVCFDLSAACSGSVFAMVTAQQYLMTGAYKNVLVIGAEVLSGFIDWTDRGTCILFGDGAGACVMQVVKRGGILATDMGSDGSAAGMLYMPGGGSKHPPSHASVDQRLHFLRMDGTEVFKLAVRNMSESANRVMRKARLKPEHVECFIPHQANTRIIEAVAKFAKLPPEKVFVNLQKYGNTSAASSLIALYEAVKKGAIKKGDHVVMVSFGAGMTWGSIAMQW